MPPKRRRRFHGLYYHSSPPKVMPMNGQAGGLNGSKRRSNDDFSVKLSTIRIWMHEKDIGKLTRILWAGQGHRLCQQASNNGRVKRFLAAVPHVMNAIRDLHQAVIDNSLETVQAQLEPPVSAALVTCRDGNGLNVIHKAAGLGHTKILEYLVGLWPEGAHEMDITGKTPLHWAASAKNNMRCYTLLTQAGCDEEALDYKMKTPSYYRHKPHEIERAFLVYVPEAPRVSPESITDWGALSDENGGDAALEKKLEMKPQVPTLNGRKSLDDSIENTSELDTNDGTSANDEEEDLSKADLDVDVDEAEAEAEAEVEVAPLQRRPETPATFNNGHINGDGDDIEGEVEVEVEGEVAVTEEPEPEAENIARAVDGQGGEQQEEQPQEEQTVAEQTEEQPATESEPEVNEKTEEARPETEAVEETEKINEPQEEQPEAEAEEQDNVEQIDDNDEDDDEVHFGVL
ncbi:serrate RNA effector molecule homolog [Drosophila guanche]|uniref:serrate RNA effector molecule homolog n=1 Tax=Drosophila guanche TaxID=7266 RepID=UPI001470D077|nr:serrate RNA effector molecule homolog [Drosophila guanche]